MINRFRIIPFLFNDTAPPEFNTLSLHDALPISAQEGCLYRSGTIRGDGVYDRREDRKSTRLNSSHRCISYAVFCLKKKTIGRTARRHYHAQSRGAGSYRSTPSCSAGPKLNELVV